jgi:amidohydrolase
MSLHDKAKAAISNARTSLLELSHDIHAHPEIGYEEFYSSAATAKVLKEAGFSVEANVAGLATGFRATKGTGALHIALCAEFDALPDVGHACGHNIIASSSVGAGIGLAAVADDIDATIVVLGTPSEEGGGGKIDMINAGVFDDIHAAMMVHPWPTERLEATCLAVDHFDVTFVGKEAHASAAPWEGINALDAMTISQVAIALLRQQLVPGDQIHGIVLEGGSAANIIPAKVIGRYMCRSVTAERLAKLRTRVKSCFDAGALATGATVHYEEIGNPFSHMVSDVDILAHYRTSAEELGRNFSLDDEGAAKPTISTDMSNVSLVVPSIHPLIAIDTHGAVNHQPEFTASCITPSADKAVIDGALALAFTGIDTARDAPLRNRLLKRTAR